MPIQTYRCAKGHEVEARVRMDLSDEPQACEAQVDEGLSHLICGLPLVRQFPTPARAFPGADAWRRPFAKKA